MNHSLNDLREDLQETLLCSQHDSFLQNPQSNEYHLGVSEKLGVYLQYHPFVYGIFHDINHPAIGVPP